MHHLVDSRSHKIKDDLSKFKHTILKEVVPLFLGFACCLSFLSGYYGLSFRHGRPTRLMRPRNLFLVKNVPQGFQVLVDAADFFYLLDKTYGTDATSYWDEHDLDRQRYYRLLCFAYGKEPNPVEKRIEYYYKGALTTFIKERSGYCHYEYNDAYFSWMLVLQPYLKSAVLP